MHSEYDGVLEGEESFWNMGIIANGADRCTKSISFTFCFSFSVSDNIAGSQGFVSRSTLKSKKCNMGIYTNIMSTQATNTKKGFYHCKTQNV